MDTRTTSHPPLAPTRAPEIEPFSILLHDSAFGALRAYAQDMKAHALVLAALAPLGCASAANDQSIFNYHGETYDGGGGSSPSSPDPTSSERTIDAAACVVEGQASVTGSFAGATLAPKDAIEVFDPTKGRFTILITDYASACSLGRGIHAGSNVVSIVYDHSSLGSGTNDVTKTEGLSVTYVHYDATCKASQTEKAQSGSITFDRADDCGSAGSFDLVFGSDHVTAKFTASVCLVPSGAASCQ